ncbi:MAG TPA: hypothetical protein VLK65_06205 [Vicinamibacteria bacterium]|nr:hypothetical protein [Vicinamibacteria bacterium]
MERFAGFLALSLTLLSIPIDANAESRREGRHAYLFVAPGVLAAGNFVTLEGGGGFEWISERGLGIGVDGSWMSSPECFPCGFMTGSLDASYHFVGRARKLAPFVLGGVGCAFTFEDAVPAVSFGGGFDYWFDNRRSFRLEVRDRVYGEGVHSLGLRLGIVF